jgi:Carboxypeptidase regulatory-like domain
MGRLVLVSLVPTFASLCFATERVTLVGRVIDERGKPLTDATVMVYHAGVKTGYSIYCPSCYADCGKRATTDAAGSYTIRGLDPDLLFELLVVRDGYRPAFLNKVDPSAGQAAAVTLLKRAPIDDLTQVVRGRVVDAGGHPLRAVVVQPRGIETNWQGRGPVSLYGTVDGLEPIAVSNAEGEFELAYSHKAIGMLVSVEARGMAVKVANLPTGADRTTVIVTDGAVIRGRLVNHGKPLEGAEIGLFGRTRVGYLGHLAYVGDPYEEIRIGTKRDGTFVITNVPAPVNWYVYGKMASIAKLGATAPIECATKRDGEEVNVGDIEIQPGRRVRGKVTLNDGAAIPSGMRVSISSEQAWDTQTVLIGPDGRFEFINVPNGKYKVFASVRGYRMTGGPDKFTMETVVDRDLDGLSVVLDRARR